MGMIKAGDKIQVLDDSIEGTAVRIDGDTITILTSEGFELDYSLNEVLLVENRSQINVSAAEAQEARKEKEVPARKKARPVKPKERNAPKMEVDLHIHQLVPSTRGMSNYDMLNIQVETAKRQLDFAIKKRIRKVVFIHGVGAGILKEELYYLFRRHPNITYYDADYQKYGLGATEVYIHQNVKE
ncbi:Smr/MutS family protein [Muriicola sp. SD30]|uniref:Smr/MutS family protein n=1 Tax=Muriicola sp. SD30 TaxID=3240936 RepID=UPI00350FD304